MERLRTLAVLAKDLGATALAADAEAMAERVAEGRFYVVCVGQFKRGKSTLLNALVGESLLPTGVVPITTAVTVIRSGDPAAARVRLRGGEWQDVDPRSLVAYVSDEQNPDNEKGVTGVEVFLPSPLLATGMCLVDTPGIGSVSEANTAATRAFVPHVDAALVVLGTDPPISGEELNLVAEVARQVEHLIFVLNKADRQSDAERREAARFTQRVIGKRLGAPIPLPLQVSATEKIAGTASHDWGALVEKLEAMASRSGADLVRAAERRCAVGLEARLLRELDDQRAALLAPLDETQRRVGALRHAVDEAAHSLQELGHRLLAAQEALVRRFTEERDRFFAQALPEANAELERAIRSEPARGAARRERAVEHAVEITRRWLERWRLEQEPRVDALYREAAARFVDLVNAFQGAVATAAQIDVAPLDTEARLRGTRHFYFTEMRSIAPSWAGNWIRELLFPGFQRRRAIERDARHYLARLFEVNSARIKNDFVERVTESRRSLEQELRSRLRELTDSAERALGQAREAHAAGAAAVTARLERLATIRRQIEAVADGQGISQ